jgi:ATP-binding cassette subfamily B protein
MVLDALKRLAAGRTTFLISHDLQLAARADLIFYLDGGRVREGGTHAELMARGGSYAALYREQAAQSTWSPPFCDLRVTETEVLPRMDQCGI